MSELTTNDVGSTVAYKTVTIENGETDSNFADIGGLKLTGLYIPAAFTGTTVAFRTSPSDEDQENNFGKVVDAGAELLVEVLPAAEGEAYAYIVLPVAKLAGIKYIRIVAGLAQDEDIEIILATTLV